VLWINGVLLCLTLQDTPIPRIVHEARRKKKLHQIAQRGAAIYNTLIFISSRV